MEDESVTRKELEFHLDAVAVGVLAALCLTVSLETYGYHIPLIRPILAFILLTFAPGMLLLALVDVPPQQRARWVCYSVGTSLILLTVLGATFDLLMLQIGVPEPLSTVPLTTFVGLLILSLTVANRVTDPSRLRVTVSVENWTDPVTLSLLLLPLLGVLATFTVSRFERGLPLVTMLLLVALLPVVAVVAPTSRWHSLAIYSSSVMLLYHSVFSWTSFHGGQGYMIRAVQVGRWLPSEYSLLPNGILYPMYAQLSGLEVLVEMSVLNPLLVGTIPLSIYVMLREYTDSRSAFAGASLFAFAHPFYTLYSYGGRVATPVIFLSLLGLVISDHNMDVLKKRGLSLAFAAGIVVSHYGTSYFMMFAVIASVFVLVGYRMVDKILEFVRGGTEMTDISNTRENSETITWMFAGYYVVLAIGWYMYTSSGAKFKTLPRHVVATVRDLLYQSGGTGGTANRLQANYGALSIRYAKYLYLIIAVLIAVGLLYVHYQRFLTDRDIRFDDEYLALASTLLVTFGTSMLFSGAWGGGRPMMIVFSLTSIFAVLGASAIWYGIRRCGAQLGARFPSGGGRAILTIVLALLLVLNTGVAAYFVLDGYAPSNVPIKSELEESDNPQMVFLLFIETDIQTHVWLGEHRNESFPIYGDKVTRAQSHDWYNSEIAVRDSSNYPILLRNDLQGVRDGTFEPGYVLLMGHNLATNSSAVGRVDKESLKGLEDEFRARNRIYDSGRSHILFAPPRQDWMNNSTLT